MTAEELEQIVHREPFQPYRLLLADGEEVIVPRPRKSHVSGDLVALVGECRRGGGIAVERFRLIPVERVKSVEAFVVP